MLFFFFFFQAEDGIRDADVTGVQTCALPIYLVFRKKYILGGILTMLAAALEIAANHFQMTYYLLIFLVIVAIYYSIYYIKLRSEEHTSELQSRPHLVCRLLLEKKNKTII